MVTHRCTLCRLCADQPAFSTLSGTSEHAGVGARARSSRTRRRSPARSGAVWRPRASPSTSPSTAPTGSGWRTEQPYDVIVLDIMLPGMQRLPGLRAACATAATGRRSSCSPPRTASTTRPRRSTPAPTTSSPSRSRSSCCSPGCGRCSGGPAAAPPGRLHARATSPSTRSPTACRRGDADVDAHRARVRGARVPHAPRRRGRVEGARSSTTCGTSTSTATPTSSRCTSATCAASSTSRSAGSSIETIRGAGYRLDPEGG